MKTVCIYHSRDLDGWMSAAIVKKWFSFIQGALMISKRSTLLIKEEIYKIDIQLEDTIEFIGYDYGQPIPYLDEYSNIIMCDVSFPKEVMETIAYKLIWIDHHKSAIDIMDSSESFMSSVKGRMTQTNYAACELTWHYFFPDKAIPELVRLLGRYDCFGHKGTEEELKVLQFQYGARQVIGNMVDAYDYLTHVDRDIWYNILLKGEVIYVYLCKEAQQIYKKSFEKTFIELIHNTNEIKALRKFLCVNQERFNPINFGIDYHNDGYDGFACFWYSNGKWSFSLYNDNNQVDCSVIAKQFGGGGHKGAAGFVVDDIAQFLNNK